MLTPGFELWFFGLGSNHSTNGASTTALCKIDLFLVEVILFLSLFHFVIQIGYTST